MQKLSAPPRVWRPGPVTSSEACEDLLSFVSVTHLLLQRMRTMRAAGATAVCSLLLLLGPPAAAVTFYDRISSTSDDVVDDVACNANTCTVLGNTVGSPLSSHLSSTSNTNIGAPGGKDMFVAAYNTTTGTSIHFTRFGTTGPDTPARIGVDSSSNAYVVGIVEAAMPAGQGPATTFRGLTDAFIAKFNSESCAHVDERMYACRLRFRTAVIVPSSTRITRAHARVRRDAHSTAPIYSGVQVPARSSGP